MTFLFNSYFCNPKIFKNFEYEKNWFAYAGLHILCIICLFASD